MHIVVIVRVTRRAIDEGRLSSGRSRLAADDARLGVPPLIRGFGHYESGLNIDFEISLPTDTAPIRGSGTITRHAERRVEGIDGLGIKFTSFHAGDQVRLTSFLASRG